MLHPCWPFLNLWNRCEFRNYNPIPLNQLIFHDNPAEAAEKTLMNGMNPLIPGRLHSQYEICKYYVHNLHSPIYVCFGVVHQQNKMGNNKTQGIRKKEENERNEVKE